MFRIYGQIGPDHMHLPGIYDHRIIKGEKYEKRIEKLKLFTEDKSEGKTLDDLKRERIAKRAAKELRDGMYVNLGIGIPTIIPNYADKNISYVLHSENGMLGMSIS
jgi:3-oxoacid CoA-transferase